LFPPYTEESVDTKGVIRIHKANDIQRNGQMDTRTNNDVQNTNQKTENRTTRTPLKIGGEIMCSGRLSSSCPTSGTRYGCGRTGKSLQHA
jgi:hypothetical protein